MTGLLRRLARATIEAVAPPIEPGDAAPTSRINRAAGVRTGDIAPGQMAAIPAGYLSTIVENQDRRPERSRINPRDDGYLHVSSFINACARREVIAYLYAPEHFNRVTAAHRLVWDIGRSVEKHIRTQFIKGTEARGVYGRWECRCGYSFHVGMKPQATGCSICSFPRDRFVEEPIRNDKYMLTGSADLPVMFGDYLLVTEIKSMNKDDFEKLDGPKGDHVTQVGSYRRLYKEAGWKVHDKALVIYANKAFRMGSPYREFQVDCTDAHVERQVNIVFRAAAAVKRHREARSLPARTVCSGLGSKMAKECPLVGLCFNLD